VRYCSKNFPNLHVIARAMDPHHVYDLYAAGCRDIIRDYFDSSVRAGRSALEALGMHPFEAERKAKTFIKTDQQMLQKLASVYNPEIPVHENPEYVKRTAEVREESETILRGQDRIYRSRTDRGWTPPSKKDVEAVIEEAKEEV
jgi:CPA2 family monovalent cation:H+ antiporter-2